MVMFGEMWKYKLESVLYYNKGNNNANVGFDIDVPDEVY